MSDLALEVTPIPGLVVLRLDVREDSRGWFKENWQREKMVDLGLPDFGPVQHNVSFNTARGATRGIHTEPWDKFVSILTGRVFGAWVDMREGATFGTVFTIEMDPHTAVFVPRGVGNSYQTLEDATTYSYLVNEHWRPGTAYPALNLADETVAIDWPIPLAESEISEKDLNTPRMADVVPMKPLRTLIIGALGQLGRALRADFPDADLVDMVAGPGVDVLDVSDSVEVEAFPWHEYALVLNAAAYTAVDKAETTEGRAAAWAANAAAPATLARIAAEHRITLVHYSTDYVFDGTAEVHTEDERYSPLGVYAQTKAAGDIAVATAPRHYILRTSWVIGDGHNFVRTMQKLAGDGVSPTVVDDQVGRLTFTPDLSRATRHLVDQGAPFGIYNVQGAGRVTSWCDLAREVYRLSGRAPEDVTPVTTEEYVGGREGISPRPANGTLDLSKIEATGFTPGDHLEQLAAYCASQPAQRP
jgi:dTDP-4-dehydrorhamnose 3,5-epimerase